MTKWAAYDSGIHLGGNDPKYDRAATAEKQIGEPYDLRPLPLRRVPRRDDVLSSVGVAGDWSAYLAPADALRIFLSGAGGDGGEQSDVAASLGGWRSSTEADRIGRTIARGIGGVRIGLASGRNGLSEFVGIGSLAAAGPDRVNYIAPGSNAVGPDVRLSPGIERTIVDGEDRSKWVRATLVPSDDPDDAISLAAAASLEFFEQFARLFGFADVDDPPDAFTSWHRAGFLRAVGARIDDLRAWVGSLGAAAASDGGHLPASGEGTIVADDHDAFADWPHKGWTRIVDAGGDLREIVHYDGRTGSTLHVPAGGRGCLQTVAAEGAADDVLIPVPPIRLAFEPADPLTEGEIQTIADHHDTPVGLDWSSGVEDGEGTPNQTLRNRQQVGMWVEMELCPDAAAFSRYEIRIELAWRCLGQECRETIRGLFRVGRSSLDRYELRASEGMGTPIDRDAAPLATSGSLPWTPTIPFTPGVWNLVVDRRNRYDMVSRSIAVRTITISDDVEIVDNPPTAPELQELRARGDGHVFALGAYFHRLDPAPADVWQAFHAVGVDPDPDVDAPIETPVEPGNALALVVIDLGAFTAGDEVRCLLRLKRTADGRTSLPSEILRVVAEQGTPAEPTGETFFSGGPQAGE